MTIERPCHCFYLPVTLLVDGHSRRPPPGVVAVPMYATARISQALHALRLPLRRRWAGRAFCSTAAAAVATGPSRDSEAAGPVRPLPSERAGPTPHADGAPSPKRANCAPPFPSPVRIASCSPPLPPSWAEARSGCPEGAGDQGPGGMPASLRAPISACSCVPPFCLCAQHGPRARHRPMLTFLRPLPPLRNCSYAFVRFHRRD